MTRDEIAKTILALAIGAAGAAAGTWIGIPAPLLTGPALAVLVGLVAGLKLSLPHAVVQVAILAIGIIIGLGVTQEALVNVIRWPLSFALLSVSLIATIGVGTVMLRRIWGYDRKTALMAAMPGHLTFSISLSESAGANVAAVGLIHNVRVGVLLFLVPLTASLVGLPDAPAEATDIGQISWLQLIAVVAAAVAAGLGLRALGVAAPLMIGGMVAAALLRLTGFFDGDVPDAVTWPAFVVMGTLMGVRFSGIRPREAARHLVAGSVFTGMALMIAVGLAAAASLLADLPLTTMLVAFIPGGFEVSAAMALALGLDTTLVAAHHVFRLMVLPFVGALVAQMDRADQ